MMARVSRQARGFGGLSAGAGCGGPGPGTVCRLRLRGAGGAGGGRASRGLAGRGSWPGRLAAGLRRAAAGWHQQLPAVADQPGGDGDQDPAQGGDHGLAAADPVAFYQLAAGYQAGELVQPGGDRGGDQRRPHPAGVDLGGARRQVPQRGAVLAVAEDVLDAGAVPVPVLHRGRLGRGGHVHVGADETVGVDSGFSLQLRDRQRPLVRGRVRRRRDRGSAET